MSGLLHCKFAGAGCFENFYRGCSGGKGSESLCSQQAYLLKFEGCLSTTCLITNVHRVGAIADFRKCGTQFTSVIAMKRTTREGTHYFLTIWDAVNVPFLSLEINRNSQQVYPDQSCRQQYVRTIIAYFCTAGIFVLRYCFKPIPLTVPCCRSLQNHN